MLVSADREMNARVAAALKMKELLRKVQLKKKQGIVLGVNATQKAAAWTDEDERIVLDNLKRITQGFEDIVQLYKRTQRDPAFQGGRLLLLLDKDASIKDMNHHILPHFISSQKCMPDLFSDDVFESWYKTGEIFKTVIKENQYFRKLAMKHGDEAVKKLVNRTKQALNANPSGNIVIAELAFSLTEDGGLENCMCAFYDDLAMSLSIRQRTRLLVVLNRINNDGVRNPMSPRSMVPDAFKFPILEKHHIAYYKCPPAIVCPYLFKILDWLQKEGDISIGRYQKKVKRAMEQVSGYLALLHEKAMSPLNLGLRALMVCTATT
jgi:hypothetical protein